MYRYAKKIIAIGVVGQIADLRLLPVVWMRQTQESVHHTALLVSVGRIWALLGGFVDDLSKRDILSLPRSIPVERDYWHALFIIGCVVRTAKHDRSSGYNFRAAPAL